MNDEQLATTLAQHLDALLADETLLEAPAELAELLEVAQTLSLAAPAPRPEFGPMLKESLLRSAAGGNVQPPANGTLFSHPLFLVLVAGALILLVILATLRERLAFNDPPATTTASPALAPLQMESTPAQLTPAATATVTTELTKPSRAGDSLTPSWVAPTATTIVDVLPSLTNTVESGLEILLPANLAPGQPDSGGGDNNSSRDNSSGAGQSDDHNRGHGNDSDHHDQDNPGHENDDD